MESNENMEHTENYKYIMKCLKEIRLELRDLTHENIELKTRNKFLSSLVITESPLFILCLYSIK